MKKCGFTIVELIVSIALIAMLSTILTVVIVKKMKAVKDTTYNLLIESIEVAAEEYSLNNEAILTSYAENDWIKIPLSTLIEKNYFEDNLINPKTKKELPITDYVYVTRNYKGKVESHYNINQKTSPNITLNGKYNMYIKLNSPFEDPGVIAFDSDGNNVTNLVTKSGTVDTTQRGEYVISYKYNSTTITRNVIVGDKKNDGAVWYTLTIDPSGGYFNESNETTIYNLKSGRNQDLSTITKEGNEFVRWDYTCTECSISDGIFTMGTSNVTLVAVWYKYPKLTVNLAGGTTVQTFDTYYRNGNTIELLKPIKAANLFRFWTISGEDAELDENVLTIREKDVTLTANWLAYTDMFTYTVNGNPGVQGTDYIINDDGDENWRIKFLKTGTLRPLIDMSIDAFLVGGGGGGAPGGNASGRGGGGGGRTTTKTSINLTKGEDYPITIGGGGSQSTAGGSTTAFTYSITGGNGAPSSGGAGGSGGSGGGAGGYDSDNRTGGAGGSNGASGKSTSVSGGSGQGSITNEFSETTGDLYAGGGGGGGYYSSGTGGAGGAGGGARGGNTNTPGNNATANTGGGGGGGAGYQAAGGKGGSGIVVIRNSKTVSVGNTVKFTFKAIGPYRIIDGDTDNWKIKFIGNSTFIPLSDIAIDAFLVGGGGGGGSSSGHGAGGGGGGGRTTTQLDVALIANTSYPIVIGTGGKAENSGASTTAFGYSAAGGSGASGYSGASGGSGGGGSSGYNESYPFAGYGGSDGTNGGSGAGDSTAGSGGSGQGSTTREFGELAGTLYGAGGSGGVHEYGSLSWVRAGGATGGGTGGSPQTNGSSGTANTGGGGGGGAGWYKSGGSGGSGVLVIRPS